MIKNIWAPDIFNYTDYKSNSWHRAKKIREKYLWTTNIPTSFSDEKFLSTLLYN